MPFFDFENIETHEIREIWIKNLTAPRVYNGEDNNEKEKWKVLMCRPNMSVSSIIDPYDSKSFRAATTNKKGQTIGQLWERSAELSQKRADKEGKDPIRQKRYAEYKKSTGVKHFKQAQEETAIKAKETVKKFLNT